MLNKNKIDFEIKIAQLNQQKVANIGSVEDVLKKLF